MMNEQENVKRFYANVNGLNMYYEIHGVGKPMVLLHGALTTIDISFGKMLPTFAKNRQVIAIEQQGHGHTEDIDRPMSFEQMADDTAELLKQLGIEKADILGYSMGGIIAVELGIRYPDLVHKLVIISSPYNRDAWISEAWAAIEAITPEMFKDLQEAYAKVAPNPDGWATLVEKVKKFALEYIGSTTEEFRSIKAPTMIVIGDSDVVRSESAVEMFKLLGGGVFGGFAGLPYAQSQLVVLPGTTHVGMIERAEWLVPMITEFLAAANCGESGCKR